MRTIDSILFGTNQYVASTLLQYWLVMIEHTVIGLIWYVATQGPIKLIKEFSNADMAYIKWLSLEVDRILQIS